MHNYKKINFPFVFFVRHVYASYPKLSLITLLWLVYEVLFVQNRRQRCDLRLFSFLFSTQPSFEKKIRIAID